MNKFTFHDVRLHGASAGGGWKEQPMTAVVLNEQRASTAPSWSFGLEMT
jgi:hypothetical protein